MLHANTLIFKMETKQYFMELELLLGTFQNIMLVALHSPEVILF